MCVSILDILAHLQREHWAEERKVRVVQRAVVPDLGSRGGGQRMC